MRTLCVLLVLTLSFSLPTAAFADDKAEVTFSFEDTDVRKVIETLAQFGGKNVIVHPKVKGKVTVHLKDTPWKTALETVVRSVGAQVQDQGNGIYMITPKPRVVSTALGEVAAEQKRLRALERELATSRAVQADLEAQRALEAQAKLRALERRLAESEDMTKQAEAKRAALDLEISDYKKRVVDLESAREARLLTDAANDAFAKVKKQPPVVQIHDARDLEKLGIDTHTLARRAAKQVNVRRDPNNPGILVIRGYKAAQEHVAKRLHEARERLARGEDPKSEAFRRFIHNKRDPRVASIVVGSPNSTMTTTTNAEGVFEITTRDKQGRLIKKKAVVPGYTETDVRGRVINSYGELVDGAKVRYVNEWTTLQADAKAQINELRQRADQLKKAAALLKQAGDREGAARAMRQMNDLKERADTLRAELATKAAANNNAYRLHMTKANGTEQAIHALRKEVGALRNEVRQLTDLVKQLVQQRRPARGR